MDNKERFARAKVSRVILPRVTSLRQEINNIFEMLETPYRVDFEPLVNNDGMLTGVKIRCYSNMRWTSYDDIGSMAQQNLLGWQRSWAREISTGHNSKISTACLF